MKLLQYLFIAMILIGTVHLWLAEGWVSGAVFFVFMSVALGLMFQVAEIFHRLFSRLL